MDSIKCRPIETAENSKLNVASAEWRPKQRAPTFWRCPPSRKILISVNGSMERFRVRMVKVELVLLWGMRMGYVWLPSLVTFLMPILLYIWTYGGRSLPCGAADCYSLGLVSGWVEIWLCHSNCCTLKPEEWLLKNQQIREWLPCYSCKTCISRSKYCS